MINHFCVCVCVCVNIYLDQVGRRPKYRRSTDTLLDRPEKPWRRERKQLPMSDTVCVERSPKSNRSRLVPLRNGTVPNSPDHHRGITFKKGID